MLFIVLFLFNNIWKFLLWTKSGDTE